MKQKTNLLIFAALLIVALLVCGCSKNNGPAMPTEKDLNKGGEGLKLKLLSNMPPNEVWKDKPFVVGFDVQNKGIVAANDVIVSISSCKSAGFKEGSFYYRLNIPEIRGKTKFNPDGEIGGPYTAELNAIADDTECMFTVEMCYPFETQADIDVCIDPDVYNLKTKKVCQIKESKVEKQAAPVVVSRIEEDIIPLENSMNVRFKIYLQNAGSGQITGIGSYEKICGSDQYTTEDLNKVEARVKLSNMQMVCQPSSVIMTENPESNYVVCETSIDRNKEAYLTPLTIALRYGYVDTQYKTIRIKKAFV